MAIQERGATNLLEGAAIAPETKRRRQLALERHMASLWKRLIEEKSLMLELEQRRHFEPRLDRRSPLTRDIERYRGRLAETEDRVRQLSRDRLQSGGDVQWDSY